jgi:hypothetical protein
MDAALSRRHPAAFSGVTMVGMHNRVAEAAASHDWDSVPEMPSNLPLLDRFRTLHRSRFDGWDMLLIQHHLGTFLPLVDALVDDGMSVDRSWLIDIPYSTNVEVNDLLRRRWAEGRCPLPPLFSDPLSDYSEAQHLRACLMIAEIRRRASGRPLLVIDDGAYFAKALLSLVRIGHLRREDFGNLVLVEQTTRGHRFLSAHEGDLRQLDIPAVSIAGSVTKKTVEAPFIGAAVSAAIRRRVPSARKILVLGYGVIGEATATYLRPRFPWADLFVVEKRTGALRRASRESRGRWQVLRGFGKDHVYDLVVGCTGSTAFTVEDRHRLADGAFLASGSSAAIEFDRNGFVDLADFYPDDEIEIVDRQATRNAGIHADIRLRLEGARHVTFLNAGFPVNFDGRRESLSVSMIQGTRCLLYAAAAQATRTRAAGLHALDAGRDDWIKENALDLL